MQLHFQNGIPLYDYNFKLQPTIAVRLRLKLLWEQKPTEPNAAKAIKAMKALGTVGMMDVPALEKALQSAVAQRHNERAQLLRDLIAYKKSKPKRRDRSSGGSYRASIEKKHPLDDPSFKAWANKRGVAPTTQKRNEYDKAMADTLKNRLSRWIKGVSVERVNFIAPEEGGDVRAAKIGTTQVTRPYLEKK